MNKQIKFGIILQYAQMFLSILISLIYTPVMLKILGQSEYGIYNLASSIISYLSLLSLGFGSSYMRFYSRYKAKDDIEGIKKLNGLYLIVFSLIGLVTLVSGLFLSNNVSVFFNRTYSYNDLHIAKILMIFLSINLAVSFPASVFVSYVTSQEKFIFQKIVNIGKTILSPILSVVLLFMGHGSIGMVVITTVISLVVDLINVIYCFKKLDMKISFIKLDYKLLKEIAIFSAFIAMNQVIDQINWQTDKIILGKMISGSAVAVYAVASTINTMYINFSTAIAHVFEPKINLIESSNDERKDDKLNSLFIKVGRIQYMILLLILSGFVFFGKYFIIKWAGEEYELSYYITLLLIVPATISLCQNIGLSIQRAKNKHQFRSIAYLIMAILNIIISIFLTKWLGTVGAAIGTTISILLANILVMNIYYQKKMNINVIDFWKNIFKITGAAVIPFFLGILLNRFVFINSIWLFFILVLSYSLVYLIFIYLFAMNKEEKSYITKIFK